MLLYTVFKGILLMFAIQDRGLYAITNLRRNRN